jgi:hypothetical protein
MQKFILELINALTPGKKSTLKDLNNCDYRVNNLLNIKQCTISQRIKNKSDIYKGVKKTNNNRYIATISKSSKKIHLGSFDTPEEAAEAYNKKSRELFGKFAYQNDIKKSKKSN